MRISVMREEEPLPDSEAPVGGCPVNLTVRKDRWLAEIQDPVACASTVADMNKLGPEARANLARHLETDDPQLSGDIKQMRKRRA
jgi:hypothetical protein